MVRENVWEARTAWAKTRRQRIVGYCGETEEVHDGRNVGPA